MSEIDNREDRLIILCETCGSKVEIKNTEHAKRYNGTPKCLICGALNHLTLIGKPKSTKETRPETAWEMMRSIFPEKRNDRFDKAEKILCFNMCKALCEKYKKDRCDADLSYGIDSCLLRFTEQEAIKILKEIEKELEDES